MAQEVRNLSEILCMARCKSGRQSLSIFSLALSGLVRGQVIPGAPVMLVAPMTPRLMAQIQGAGIYPRVAAHRRCQMTIPMRFASSNPFCDYYISQMHVNVCHGSKVTTVMCIYRYENFIFDMKNFTLLIYDMYLRPSM